MGREPQHHHRREAGIHDGALIIKPTGDVYYRTNECCDDELISPSNWIIPDGHTWLWEVVPGVNRILIHLNECCTGATCVYVQHEAIAL